MVDEEGLNFKCRSLSEILTVVVEEGCVARKCKYATRYARYVSKELALLCVMKYGAVWCQGRLAEAMLLDGVMFGCM